MMMPRIRERDLFDDHGQEIIYNEGKNEMGPKIKELYDTLTGIQMGRLPAPEGWVYTID